MPRKKKWMSRLDSLHFDEHRRRVSEVKSSIDCKQTYHHVRNTAGKEATKRLRLEKIEKDNMLLLDRLGRVMHRAPKPADLTPISESLSQIRIGNAMENRRKQLEKIEQQNEWLLSRIKNVEPAYKATFEIEAKKMDDYMKICCGLPVGTNYSCKVNRESILEHSLSPSSISVLKETSEESETSDKKKIEIGRPLLPPILSTTRKNKTSSTSNYSDNNSSPESFMQSRKLLSNNLSLTINSEKEKQPMIGKYDSNSIISDINNNENNKYNKVTLVQQDKEQQEDEDHSDYYNPNPNAAAADANTYDDEQQYDEQEEEEYEQDDDDFAADDEDNEEA